VTLLVKASRRTLPAPSGSAPSWRNATSRRCCIVTRPARVALSTRYSPLVGTVQASSPALTTIAAADCVTDTPAVGAVLAPAFRSQPGAVALAATACAVHLSEPSGQ
jgi:hypothetical protein